MVKERLLKENIDLDNIEKVDNKVLDSSLKKMSNNANIKTKTREFFKEFYENATDIFGINKFLAESPMEQQVQKPKVELPKNKGLGAMGNFLKTTKKKEESPVTVPKKAPGKNRFDLDYDF